MTLHAAASDSCLPPSGESLTYVLAVWTMILCKSPFFGLILILEQFQAVRVTSGPSCSCLPATVL